jgi:hypothetical protein
LSTPSLVPTKKIFDHLDRSYVGSIWVTSDYFLTVYSVVVDSSLAHFALGDAHGATEWLYELKSIVERFFFFEFTNRRSSIGCGRENKTKIKTKRIRKVGEI